MLLYLLFTYCCLCIPLEPPPWLQGQIVNGSNGNSQSLDEGRLFKYLRNAVFGISQTPRVFPGRRKCLAGTGGLKLLSFEGTTSSSIPERDRPVKLQYDPRGGIRMNSASKGSLVCM